MTKESQPNSFELGQFDFIVKSGRAVALPVYDGAMERFTDDTQVLREVDENFGTRRYVDYTVKVVTDFRRALDYLETRADIDRNKLAFYGFSEGGIWSPILLAVEGSRIKVAVNHLGGLYTAPYLPVADPFNYLPRAKAPVLMLNGVYDTNLTLKEEVEPMYRLLGTPEKDKKLILYETDHFIPRTELIKESLAWYDKYLGPAR
jgi:dipeptidyl aminopeptidase/acylaminoacyl peptidase